MKSHRNAFIKPLIFILLFFRFQYSLDLLKEIRAICTAIIFFKEEITNSPKNLILDNLKKTFI